MKIDFNIPQNSISTDLPQSSILSEGIHEVKVSSITIGTNVKTGNRFFKCVFTNHYGFLPQWFYDTQASKPFLKKLFNAAGIYDEIAEVKDLLFKNLNIHVRKSHLINPQTGEVIRETFTCVHFESALPV